MLGPIAVTTLVGFPFPFLAVAPGTEADAADAPAAVEAPAVGSPVIGAPISVAPSVASAKGSSPLALTYQDEPEADEEEEDPVWTGSVDAGFTTTSGNTDTTTTAVNVQAQRETEIDRFTFSAYYNTQEDGGATTADKSGALLQYDYFVSEKWYLYASTRGDRDKLANLDLRYRIGGGGGYQIYDEEKRKLSVEAGLTYINENFDTDPDDFDISFLSARLAAHYEQELRENVSFASDIELYPSLEDSEDFTGRSDSRLRVKLSESMYSQFQAVFDYDNSPVPGNDELDSRFIVTVGWAF